MFEGNEYVQAVRKMFYFLSEEYGMTETKEEIRGNVYYDVEYHSASKVISISYENIEDYFQVIVFKLKDGKLPEYDDKTQTLHLNILNKLAFSIATKSDIELNNEYFSNIIANTKMEQMLLKSARELRLVMRLVKI